MVHSAPTITILMGSFFYLSSVLNCRIFNFHLKVEIVTITILITRLLMSMFFYLAVIVHVCLNFVSGLNYDILKKFALMSHSTPTVVFGMFVFLYLRVTLIRWI